MKRKEENKENIFSSLLGEKTVEKTAGLSFSAAALFPVLVTLVFILIGSFFGAFAEGYEKTDWYKYFNFLLPQIAYALVAVLFFYLSRLPVTEIAGKTSPKYYLLAVLLQLGLFSLSDLNVLFLEFLESHGYHNTPIELPSLDGFGLAGVLVVVAVLPAIFEELLFRGIVLKGLRSFSPALAVVLCGALFAVFHQNPAQTVYQFCCGAAFALLAFRSGSVLPTVLAHFINNATVILLAKFASSSLPLTWQIVLFSIEGLCLLGAVGYLIFFDKNKPERGDKKQGLSFLFLSSVGVIVSLVSWFTNLFSGV